MFNVIPVSEGFSMKSHGSIYNTYLLGAHFEVDGKAVQLYLLLSV